MKIQNNSHKTVSFKGFERIMVPANQINRVNNKLVDYLCLKGETSIAFVQRQSNPIVAESLESIIQAVSKQYNLGENWFIAQLKKRTNLFDESGNQVINIVHGDRDLNKYDRFMRRRFFIGKFFNVPLAFFKIISSDAPKEMQGLLLFLEAFKNEGVNYTKFAKKNGLIDVPYERVIETPNISSIKFFQD